MTLNEWVTCTTGIVLKIPAGTVTGHRWYYLEDGEWTTHPTTWVSGMPREYRPISTPRDQFVELLISSSGLETMATKALSNRSGKSVDGALTLKRRK
jgi:hypothetical protein